MPNHPSSSERTLMVPPPSWPFRVGLGCCTPIRICCRRFRLSTIRWSTPRVCLLVCAQRVLSVSLATHFGQYHILPKPLKAENPADLCRIFTIPKLGEKLKQDSTPLSYTPRKFISHPYNSIFYMIESDHRTYGPVATQRIISEKVSLLGPYSIVGYS